MDDKAINNNKTYNKVVDNTILFLIFSFAFIYSFNKIVATDTFWHLAIGRYIFTSHHIPAHDIFSYTLAYTPFYRVEWLFDVIWFIVYSVFGVAGLICFKSVISGATTVLLFLSLQHYHVNKYGRFLFITCIYFIAGSYVGDRPQIITYFGIVLLIFITSLYLHTTIPL